MGNIKLDKRNYRVHSQKNKDLIKKSLTELGAGRSVVIDSEDTLVAGNGVFEQAQKIGMPTKIIETDGSELIVVKRTDLKTDDEKRKKLALADNSISDTSEFDFDVMANDFMIEDLAEWGIELKEMFFDEEKKEVVEDDFDEDKDKVETRCKLGDLWQLGEHRLICGDSTDIAVIDRLMDGVKADMVFTDPPYGMNLDTDYSKMNGNEGHGKKYDKGFVDDFHSEMIDAIMLMNAKETFIWGADYFAELIPNRNSGSWFVWDKRENELTGANVDKRFGSMFELCWSKEKHKREIFRFMWAGMMKQKDVDDKRYHPTQKPIKLAGWFLERYSKEGQTVVDLFGGSGSTLIACEQLNRKCYMCELDPHYCDIIIARWEILTGEKATKL